MELKAGDVIYTYCYFIGKYKYLICLCPEPPYFFLINSEPRTLTPDAQVKIVKSDFPFLPKACSYIDTATFCTIQRLEIDDAIRKGSLPTHVKEEIIKVVDACRYLTQNQKLLIKTNLK